MKPKEFDELIKSKFDENEFAYNPTNWQKLVEQMDKKPGRKSRALLWLPLAALASTASIAASLAMIISMPGIWHHNKPAVYAHAHKVPVHEKTFVQNYSVQPATTSTPIAALSSAAATKPLINESKNNNTVVAEAATVPQATITNQPETSPTPQPIAATDTKTSTTFNTHTFADVYPDNFFVPQSNQENIQKTMVSIAGGVNYGSVSTGYAIGATGKHMLNDKLYIEGDVAFVNSSTPAIAGTSSNSASGATTPSLPTAKLSSTTSTEAVVNPPKEIRSTPGTPKESNYNIYYAQVAPSVGYNVLKHFSVGVGADVQRLIQDDRPENADNIDMKEAPAYDLGVIGKTEYTLSSKIKAGIYYRQGLNNMLSATNRYIDRSYIQLQIKYTILRK